MPGPVIRLLRNRKDEETPMGAEAGGRPESRVVRLRTRLALSVATALATSSGVTWWWPVLEEASSGLASSAMAAAANPTAKQNKEPSTRRDRVFER
jgi:hypothetical protein